MKDGESDSRGGRWCEHHGQWHGSLFLCPEYTEETKAVVRDADARLRANLQSPQWQAEQLRLGIPQDALNIMKIFGGVK